MRSAIEVLGLEKKYSNGFKALSDINLNIQKGEIFALLGPNGAGKTTLINAICGIVKVDRGSIKIFGFDNVKEYRIARSHIGLVPQELTTDTFETVWNTISFSRGLFGKPPKKSYLIEILKKLSLFEKRDAQIRTLSGGMKRRVLIAKALSHEPDILFLDEPSAGVDVELRKSMWSQVRQLRDIGVTIILTTHYIEEAEEMADRIGIINMGKLSLIEEKNKLMKKLGSKEIVISLKEPILNISKNLKKFGLFKKKNENKLIFRFEPEEKKKEISKLFDLLKKESINYHDIDIQQSSLEEIFVELIGKK